MKITVLGCGSSAGTPVIGNDWGKCDPNNQKNRRTRPSILIESEKTTVLVDTGPDLRDQFNREEVKTIDAVLYTHEHADHTHGIDDLRTLSQRLKKPIDIYGDHATLSVMEEKYQYIFAGDERGFYPKRVAPHRIEPGMPFTVGDIENIVAFEQDHGPGITSLGFRIGSFAYSTDVAQLDEAAFEALEGVETWIVDAHFGWKEENTIVHATVPRVLLWLERVKPRQTYLTHLTHLVDYQTLLETLPPHVEPAYDGLVIEV